jgi:hypothetical protein
MAYTINPGSTAITTVGSTAGQIPTTHDIELVNFWMKPVEPHEHELLQWLGPLRGKINQQTHSIGQSYLPPVTDTLAADTASASPTIDTTGVPADEGFKVNDLIEILEYYSGQTTYFDPTKTTYHRVSAVNAGTLTAAANIGAVHPSTVSVVRVYSKATPMATAFGSENVFRGDRIDQTVMRLQSEFIKVDKRMRHTPTHESRDHFVEDMEGLKKLMNDKLEEGYVKSTYAAESGSTPGTIRGMIDWADEISANVLDLSGAQITVHHLRNRVTQKRKVHSKRAGNTVICDLDTMEALDLVLEPYKLYDEKSNSISIQVDSMNFRWGNLKFMPVTTMKEGTALISSKEDWGAGNYDGMPWTPVRQDLADTGGTWEAFGIFGDFTLDCYDVYRQIVIKNINTYVSRYAGARSYGQSG